MKRINIAFKGGDILMAAVREEKHMPGGLFATYCFTAR